MDDFCCWPPCYLGPSSLVVHRWHVPTGNMELKRVNVVCMRRRGWSCELWITAVLERYPPEVSQLAPEKWPGPNRKVIFQPPFFTGYVKLQESRMKVCLCQQMESFCSLMDLVILFGCFLGGEGWVWESNVYFFPKMWIRLWYRFLPQSYHQSLLGDHGVGEAGWRQRSQK